MLTIINYTTPEGEKKHVSYKWTYEAKKAIKELEAQGCEIRYLEMPFGNEDW